MLTESELTAKGYHNKNAITGRFYLGLENQIALNELGCKSTERITFFQAKQNGYTIEPGSKGVVVTYKEFIPVNETDSQDNIISTKQVPYVVHHTVFNLDQCTKEDECTLPAFDKAQKTFEHRSKLISNKQKEFLTKLIQSKYKDKYKQETQLQKLPELTKAQANNHIKELLSK